MARSGRFGRRPRPSGGNLSALIAALTREFKAAQDKAIFDAYNNGGLFEGKPVDDSRLLEYIQTRRDGFSQDDPLWDQWNNSLIQQKFTIGEQKIALAYKQGKVGAGAVAAFYKDQLSSIPKDSAFYRDVASRAAEWAKAAKQSSGGGGGGSGGGGGKSAYKEYQDAGNALQDQLANNQYLDFAIRAALAREGYVIPDSRPVSTAGADVIQSLFDRGKVVGQDGNTVTIDSYRQTAQTLDDAYARAITAYKAAGYNYLTLINQRHDFQRETLTQISAIPYQVRAERVYDTLSSELEAAQGSPQSVASAYKKAQAAMDAIYGEAQRGGADADTLALLKNDAKSLAGGTPQGPGMIDLIAAQNEATGQNTYPFLTPEQGVGSYAAQIALDLNDTIKQQQQVTSGKGYLVQDPTTKIITTVDASEQPPESLGQEYQPTVMMVGGVPTQVYLAGTPIFLAAKYDENGGIAPLPNPRTVPSGLNKNERVFAGYEFTYNLGGNKVTAWAVATPKDPTNLDGGYTLTFTTKNPFTGSESRTPDGIVVSAPTVGTAGSTLTDWVAPSAILEGTSALAIDPAATGFIQADPTRAYQLYATGKMSAETFIEAVLPNAPAGTTPEGALGASVAQAYDAREANRLRVAGGVGATPAVTPQQIAISQATTILGNLGTYTPRFGAAPTAQTPPVVNWSQAITQKALIDQRAGERASLTPLTAQPSPTAPTVPAPPAAAKPSSLLKPPSTSGGLTYTGIPTTYSGAIKQPTTTAISSGRYTGKTVPL